MRLALGAFGTPRMDVKHNESVPNASLLGQFAGKLCQFAGSKRSIIEAYLIHSESNRIANEKHSVIQHNSLTKHL